MHMEYHELKGAALSPRFLIISNTTIPSETRILYWMNEKIDMMVS